MVEEQSPPINSEDDALLQQQYLRALTSFEAIELSQIEVRNKLANRLNNSIRAGLAILGAIAFSILILMLTLTTQLSRISDVVSNMNIHFGSVSENMDNIRVHMDSMEQQVALIEAIDGHISVMDGEMTSINGDMNAMRSAVGGIRGNLSGVRDRVGSIALNVDRMNMEMQAMSQEIHRMGKPARSMDNMFPFP